MNRLSQKVQAGKLCDMETEPKFVKCSMYTLILILEKMLDILKQMIYHTLLKYHI